MAPNKKNEAPTVRYMTVKSLSAVAPRSQTDTTDTTDSKDGFSDSNDFSCFFFLFSNKFVESDNLN